MDRGENASDVSEARYLVSAMVASLEQHGRDAALATTARNTGLSKWTVWGILHNRRKTIGSAALAAIRNAYLRLCERQIAHLLAEVDDLKHRCGNHDDFVDLGIEAQNLVERLRQARDRST